MKAFAARLTLLALVACGAPAEEPNPNPTPQPGLATCPETIVIKDRVFEPGECQVEAGTTLTFVNESAMIHTATSLPDAPEAFDSGPLEQGDTATVTFTEPGDYPYYCTTHPDMQARIVVY